MKKDLRIESSVKGNDLHIHYRTSNENIFAPTILFAHGFTVDGTESHRMFMNLATEYNQQGMNTVMFDFQGCGYSDGQFEDFNLTNSSNDIKKVLEWVLTQPNVDPTKIIIHGQSLGTAIATIAFHDSPKINSFVLWNLSANIYERYMKLFGEKLRNSDKCCIEGKGYYLTHKFMEDVKKHDILSYFDNWSKPTLFLNSGADTTGDPRLSEIAHDKSRHITNRIIIENANHSFKCQPALEKEAIEKTLNWVKEKLNG